MPSKNYTDNRAWYLARESSEAGKAKRTVRAQARTEAIKSGKLTGKSDPREVDHKTALSKGGTNAKSNIRVTSTTANRRKFVD